MSVRKELIDQCFRKGYSLTMKDTEYSKRVEHVIMGLLEDDLRNMGDITTQTVLEKDLYDKTVKAVIEARQKGVIAGIEEVSWFYRQNDLEVAKQYKKDGDKIDKGDKILEIQGKQKDILKTERVGLNVLQRMSGIATTTRELSEKVYSFNPNAVVLCTRKTHWGVLDKKAVYVGGGGTHRLGLWDSILIKNNHLKALRNEGIKDPIDHSLTRVWNYKGKIGFIEIEVGNQEDAVSAAEKFRQLNTNDPKTTPCVIMFDNFILGEIQATIKKLRKSSLYDNVVIEASGGINPDNIVEYAKTGVDVLSLGMLTHSSKALNLHQMII